VRTVTPPPSPTLALQPARPALPGSRSTAEARAVAEAPMDERRPAPGGPSPQSLVGNAATAAGLLGVPTDRFVPDGPDLARRDLVGAQGLVGNGVVAAGLAATPVGVAARPAKPDGKKSAAPEKGEGSAKRAGPHQDPKFVALKKDVTTKKRAVATSHPPAATEASNAQGAAKAPPDDKQAQGKAANAEKMNEAQPKEFDKQAFIKAVREAIAKKAPQNLDEADKFGESGKAEEVKQEVQGEVGAGKETAAEDIATTTAAPPDTSKAVDKKVVPLTTDRPPAKPGTPDPANAVPDKLPPAATDTSEGPEQVDQQMAGAQVTEAQLNKSNEPRFKAAVKAKGVAERDSVRAQKAMRAHEVKTLAGAKRDAQGLGGNAMSGIAGTRVAAGKQVGAGKNTAKGRDETKRAHVTATLQKVFDATKKDVEDILSGLDRKVDDQFGREEKEARDKFTAEHKRLMSDYKDRRYGGWTGKARWVRDLFAGLPDEANQIYVTARDHYLERMDRVVSNIADTVAAELARAKQRIAKGRDELQAAVKRLPADLQAIGREAAGEFADRFDELRQTVDDKGTELVDTLATKYTEALKSVDDEIAAEKEKNKGLVAKAADAVAGVIKTIMELKDLLLGVLAKAGQAVMAILKDPIGFLRNLVKAVGAGLKQFLKNIGKHLQTGVMSWLLGVSARAGIQLPARFDAKGILLLIATLLGLTWAFIRSRLTRRVPERAVRAAETALPLMAKVKKEGVGGLWDDIKAQIGDLRKTLISKVIQYLIPTVIVAGITWVLSLLNPASAFIRACKLIIDIVMFIVQRARQIIDFVNAVLDAVIAIAKGGGGGVPALIERALARAIPVLIGFLAALLGIGGIANKVKQIFQTLSRPVQKAIDWIINKLIGLIKNLWAKLKARKPRRRKKPRKPRKRDKPRRGDNSPEGQRRRLRAAVAAGVKAVNRFSGRPVAGKILKPLLAAIRIRYGLDVLHPLVSGDHWAVYGRINPDLERDTGAKAEGEEPTGANPNFTADAKAFERKLAADAATHSDARRAMQTMATKAKAYIVDSLGGTPDVWDANNSQLEELLQRIGEKNVIRSGAVGDDVRALMAVFDEGLLTERFVHIVGFFTLILGRDFVEVERREMDARIDRAGLGVEFLKDRAPVLRRLRLEGLAPRQVRQALTRAIAPVPEGSEVRFQQRSRHAAAEGPGREIGVRLAETGLEMSEREVALQRTAPGQADWDKYQDVLRWHAGSKSWVMNRRSRWVQAKRALGMPLGAGPSGTTNTMMSAGQALGAEPYDTRLACIGFLVGAQHHTLVEVMVAAVPFGCDYTSGPKMYRNIQPYSEADLRRFGNGKFPDEAPEGKGTKS
jgi:hypothetical protein